LTVLKVTAISGVGNFPHAFWRLLGV